MSEQQKFDYIIVGAGSAGCVVANRLSKDCNNKVLLIEAGGKDWNPFFRLPMLMGKLFQMGIHNWKYYTEPEPYLNGRSLYWPRGKVLGGTSTINGMIYVRGNKLDYDRWAQMGNKGWSYEDVLPIFKKSENHETRTDEFHGSGGELQVCKARSDNILHDVFINAGVEAGYKKNDDFNGQEQEGMGRYDFNIKKGKRWSTSSAFLKSIKNRKNLTVITNALTENIIVKNGKTIGVNVIVDGKKKVFEVNKEIILSAGTVNSPQILLLSGIGPAAELAEHNIKSVVDLPGVGKNMQDHVDCVMAWECPKPISLYKNLRLDKIILSVLKGMLFGKGFATTFPYESGALLKSREALASPDIQYHFMPGLEKSANLYIPNPFKKKQATEVNHGFTIRIGPVNPTSHGEITLASNNPNTPPKILANYLKTEFDVKTIIDGIKIARNIIGQSVMDEFRGQELAPGAEFTSDEDLTDWLRSNSLTTFHPVGTCKMGDDPMAVVDENLKVHGIEGLRVADASIMPIITSGNTHAPTVMIGEKVAEMILKGK
ncbi:MAG: choline dehydrogenase [Rhizobiales bacterium]|nr:choline dehydrogenase [Hyphomicrobiales bacterium]NRB12912.1 choline dehydrogenase [Hyphomicrobiales bacterium]